MASHMPNIVIVTTHDTGRHFGCYGVPTVHTPTIDALANDGVKFTNMFAASSICSPSRGALLTGQYPQRNGLMGLAGGMWNWSLNNPARHLSQQLKNLGYRTGLFGVHHETADLATLGFDHISQKPQPGDDAGRPSCMAAAEQFAAYAKNRTAHHQPFYAQIGFFETHTPYDFAGVTPDRENGVHIPAHVKVCRDRVPAYLQKYIDDPHALDEHLALLQGSVRRVDQAVARIVDGLKNAGVENNTLLLFNVDHGVELPNAKWTLYDPGTEIGFIMRWPEGGVTGGRTCDWLLGNVDFVPTLLSLIGAPIPPDTDGVSFAQGCVTDCSDQPSPREAVFSLFVNAGLYAARTEQWKLIRRFSENSIYQTMRSNPLYAELYDLHADPLETNNLIDHPAAQQDAKRMSKLMWDWMQAIDDPILKGNVTQPSHGMSMSHFRAAID